MRCAAPGSVTTVRSRVWHKRCIERKEEHMPKTGVHAVQLVAASASLRNSLCNPCAKASDAHPIVLVVAGLLLGLIPGIPKVTLAPNVICLIVLPPLLYSASFARWRGTTIRLR